MRLFLLSLILMLAACGEQQSNQQSAAETNVAEIQSEAIDSVASETVRLNSWFDEQYAEQLDFSPQTKTRLGDKSD